MIDPKNIKLLILDVDGTLTDGGIYVLEDGSQFKKFNAHDGIGIKEALKSGIEIGIISHSSTSTVVEKRANMLGIKHCYVGSEPKLTVYNTWVEKMQLKQGEVAYIGDDINDLDIMHEVGIVACPSNAVDKVKKVADVILSKAGGQGCVREFIDNILLA
jgi:3-deoxy-D-manno-octulosonate 8-phosphate phosphatase (KDO 8-P phosphatase)